MATELENILERVVANFKGIIGNVRQQVLFDVADFITFLIVFVLGYIVSSFGKSIVRRILDSLGVEDFIDSLGLSGALGRYRFTTIVENLSMWYFLLIILQLTTPGLQLGIISFLFSQAYSILPGLFSFIILLSIGILGGEYISNEVKKLEFHYRDHIATFGKLFIIYLSIYFSARKFGVNLLLIEDGFAIIIVVLLISLVIGFAYTAWYTKLYVEEMRKRKKTKPTRKGSEQATSQ